MQPRKLKVVFAFFPYGGNGNVSSENPDIRNWLIPTLLHIQSDPRIEPNNWVPGVDYKDWSDTPITMCRNASVAWAQSVNADVLVMIDSDNTPDIEYGFDPHAKRFFPTSFDFLYQHYEKGPVMIGAPYCGPPIHPTKGGNENVYVFRWGTADSVDPTNLVKLDQYTREEAYSMTGIGQVDALPTGCIMYDMRIFDVIPKPYFSYEYRHSGARCDACGHVEPGPQDEKVSTEDVVATRNVSLNATQLLGYNAVYCNWDAWAGHWKPRCVGKPRIVTADQLGDHFRKAMERPGRMDRRTMNLPAMPNEPPARGEAVRIMPSTNGHKLEPEAPVDPVPVAEEQHTTEMQVVDIPDPFRAAQNTCEADLRVLQEVAKTEAIYTSVHDRTLTIVELGSWVGHSALAMLEAVEQISDVEMHCVDHFGGGNRIQRLTAETNDVYAEFCRNLGERVGTSVFVHRGDTVLVAESWTKPIDLLFIDADHSYEGVLADIHAWAPFVRENGVICGHDYSHLFPGVKQAVHEVFGYERVVTQGTVWIVRKRSGDVYGNSHVEGNSAGKV